MEHLNVGPCGEDDTVDAKDAEDDEALRDKFELSDKSPEPAWWSPVSAIARVSSMRGAGEAGCVDFVDW